MPHLPILKVLDRRVGSSFMARFASRLICVDWRDSCASQIAINERSTPACSNSIAAACRRNMRTYPFVDQRRHFCRASATCLATMRCTASALSRSPRAFGNRNFDGSLPNSSIQALNTDTARFAKGVRRSLRPFPGVLDYSERRGLNNSRISWAKASGCSIAAKCPPRGITLQRRMSLKTRSAKERGGRTIS